MEQERVKRFWDKVDKRGPDECWNWTGARDKNGYGKFAHAVGATDRAHRVSYRMHTGEPTDGVEVMHLCDNPSCVNPVHLRCGSHGENMADMARKGRHVSANRKLSDVELEVAIGMLRDGGSYRTVAESFGVHKNTLWDRVNESTKERQKRVAELAKAQQQIADQATQLAKALDEIRHLRDANRFLNRQQGDHPLAEDN